MRLPPLSIPLSFNAGYVDTAGFLALQGLFTAHVTGNFVTFGVALALGTGGAISKFLALPVFCLVILLTRMIATHLKRANWPVMRPMMFVMLALLILAAIFSVVHGPFPDGNSPAAIVMGMTLVAAMAIQNALHRVHLGKSPPTTLMTGTTTQIMLDLADFIGGETGEGGAALRARLQRMITAVVTFAVGCGVAAGAYVLSPVWCFVLPPVLVGLSFWARVATPEGD